MDFTLTEDQQAIRGLARDVAARFAPERGAAAVTDGEWFDRAAWRALAKANLLGLSLPEEVGGNGLGLLEAALVVEEAGRAVLRAPIVPAVFGAAMPVAAYGTDEQRRRLLPGVCDGSVLLTAALAEPMRADPLAPVTRASGDGAGYRVTGEKALVPLAADAERVLLPARAPEGVVVLLVDPHAAGVSLVAEQATNGEPQYAMALDDVAVPSDDVLARPADGSSVLAATVDRVAVGLSALQLGLAEQALAMTAEYVATREQFGRPIGTFQAIAVRVGDAYIDVEAMRSTLWQAIWRLDSGLPATDEITVAKFWAAEGGERVLTASVHLHGGIGVDTDYPLHRYFLASKATELTLGSASAQLARLGDSLAAAAIADTAG